MTTPDEIAKRVLDANPALEDRWLKGRRYANPSPVTVRPVVKLTERKRKR